jgi:hypothetical protein
VGQEVIVDWYETIIIIIIIIIIIEWTYGVHAVSWVQLRSYLEEKVAVPVKKTEITA